MGLMKDGLIRCLRRRALSTQQWNEPTIDQREPFPPNSVILVLVTGIHSPERRALLGDRIPLSCRRQASCGCREDSFHGAAQRAI